MLAWFGSFPLDVVKANTMSQSLDLSKQQRMNFRQIVARRYAEAGVPGFYWGIRPSILRAFFVSSTRFSGFEFALHYLTKLEETYKTPR